MRIDVYDFVFGMGVTILVLTVLPFMLDGGINFGELPAHLMHLSGIALTSIGIAFSFKKWTDIRFPDTRVLSPVIASIFVILSVISYLVLRYKPQLQIALSILVSMTVVAMGWWVQSVITARTARRQHTLNTILNTRSSEIYQRHLGNYSKLIKDDRYLHPKIAEWFHKMNSAEFENLKMPDELRDAVNGLSYVINYFEFLGLAIEQGDLDETLLRECFCGMLPKIESRGFHLIRIAQTKNEKFFCAFVNMVKRWSDQDTSLVEKYRSKPSDAPLGEPIPSDEQVAKLLKGESVALMLNCFTPETLKADT